MIHPDLKPLVWGRHLQRLLAACGVHLPSSDPPPKVVRTVPGWFQRLGAALTILGLVGAFRLVDRHFIGHAPPAVEQADFTSIGSATWNEWAGRIHQRLNPFALGSFSPDAGVPDSVVSALAGAGDLKQASAAAKFAADSAASVTDRSNAAPRHAPASGFTFRRILATAYTSGVRETDATPQITATNTATEAGTIALSRNLLRTFNSDAPFDFGDKVLIPGVGIFEVRDTMSPRWTDRADLWFSSPEKARTWGCRTVFATRVGDSAPTLAYQFPGSSAQPR